MNDRLELITWNFFKKSVVSNVVVIIAKAIIVINSKLQQIIVCGSVFPSHHQIITRCWCPHFMAAMI